MDVTDSLETHFSTEPLFQQVVLALCNKDQALALRDHKRARHHAAEYPTDEGKLWHI